MAFADNRRHFQQVDQVTSKIKKDKRQKRSNEPQEGTKIGEIYYKCKKN